MWWPGACGPWRGEGGCWTAGPVSPSSRSMSRTPREVTRPRATPTRAPVVDAVGGTGLSAIGEPGAESGALAATAVDAWPTVVNAPIAIAAANAATNRRTGTVFIAQDRPSVRCRRPDRDALYPGAARVS